MSEKKNIGLTYFFALIGGFFGLHHLYLGRTQHAILWLTTFGGFGIGIIYEFIFKLNQYVHEINQNHWIINEYERKMRERKSPAFEIKRFFSQYIIGSFYGFITYYAFSDTWLENTFLSLLIVFSTAFAIAIGTQLVGTLGPRQCSFIWPLLGSILGTPFLMVNRDTSPSFNNVAFLSSLIFEWKIDWNHEYFSKKKLRRKHILKRCILYGCSGIIFGLMLTSAIYQNFQVDIHGERVKIKDILAEFFKSQEFLQLYSQLSNVFQQLYRFYLQYGFKGIWTHIWKVLDSESDKQAFEILNLEPNASQKEIEIQCRNLPRKWHPDRYRNSDDKQKAEIIFMNIQQACDHLSDERKRRQILNSQKRENPK